jgi:hypothetical protein
MNMADQERIKQLRSEQPAAVGPLEKLAADLERNGYFVKLSKIPRAWQCTLFQEGATHQTPPTGRGETALEAMQASAAELNKRR